ncbi:MAG: class I SAM-dependent methyltransferase [Actinomycetota bacterium]|nr:class I SAM-dependent methyltransferase [Actinomycetota bacterium]
MSDHTDRTTEEREAHFHDDWADDTDPDSVDVEAVWKGIGCPEVRWIGDQLGDLRGKKVLDIGAGLGEASVRFALQGADVTSLDISPGMLKLGEKVAARYGVQTTTIVGSATDLSPFEDATFDVVYGANVLHHVEITECLDEVRRVLKPGGKAAFWDPVQYNPVINMYRKLASGVRTEDEHPLRRRDVKAFEVRFKHVETRGFWLTALLIFVRFFLVHRVHPSSERYWKLVIETQDKHAKFLRTAHRIDAKILGVVPPFRWMCWNIAVVCER